MTANYKDFWRAIGQGTYPPMVQAQSASYERNACDELECRRVVAKCDQAGGEKKDSGDERAGFHTSVCAGYSDPIVGVELRQFDGWEQDELEGNWSYAAYKAECIKRQGADRCLVLGRPCSGLRSDLMYLDSGLGVVAACQRSGICG